MAIATRWGPIEVSDAHAHLLSYPFFQTLALEKGQPGDVEGMVDSLGWEVPPEDTMALAARWEAELEVHGVSQTVLMASVPGDEASASSAVRARPERFYGYFMFNPIEAGAADRARHAFDNLGLQGLCLFPAMHGFSIDDDRLSPVFEIASERKNVVVFVHTGVLTVGVRRKLGLASRFDMSRSNPIALHRVALDYPDIRFVIPHFGAGFFREVLMLGDLLDNVYLDTSSTNGWTKYLFPRPRLTDVFRTALEVFGPQRLLFGSDSSFFPRGWNRDIFDRQIRVLEELDADEKTVRAIFGGNLTRLLR